MRESIASHCVSVCTCCTNQIGEVMGCSCVVTVLTLHSHGYWPLPCTMNSRLFVQDCDDWRWYDRHGSISTCGKGMECVWGSRACLDVKTGTLMQQQQHCIVSLGKSTLVYWVAVIGESFNQNCVFCFSTDYIGGT